MDRDAPPAGDVPAPHPHRILVVDDEEQIRRVVSHLLRLKLKKLGGVEVFSAGSAEAAITLLEDVGPVDLVITDYRMTGETGAELLARMRERWPETVRVLMSGYHDVREDVGVKNNASAIIAKPWDNEKLFSTLYGLLHPR